jgi:hypothetical protein
MVAPCLGHTCTERRYRANNVRATSVTGKSGTNCPDDKAIIDEIVKGLGEDAAEKEECPDGCRCREGTWPKTWDTLEPGVTYKTQYVTMECKADVALTYDWECQEKSGSCFRRAPKGSAK